MDWCYVWIICCIVAAYILRQLVTRNFSLNTYHLALFDEFIGNLVVTVFSLELGILADEYGAVSIVFTASFTSHFYLRYLVFLNGDASETPFYFVDDYFEKRQMHSVISNDDSYIDAIYCYCQWSMVDKNNLDILRRLACTYCAASLSGNYSWDILMALRNSSRCIEAVGVFTGTIVDFVTPFIYKPIVRALVTLGLFLTIGHVSGLWMHSVFASVLTFRCKSHRSDIEHVMAFWLGPFFGFDLAWQFRFLVRKYTKLISTDEKDK